MTRAKGIIHTFVHSLLARYGKYKNNECNIYHVKWIFLLFHIIIFVFDYCRSWFTWFNILCSYYVLLMFYAFYLTIVF